MDTNEFDQESVLKEKYDFLNTQDTDDESEDTLSFCDLPFYSNASEFEDHQDFSKEDQSSSFSSSYSSYDQQEEEDYFEFYSEEWSSSSSNSVPENIIFCGKLIPSKKPISNSDSFYNSKSTSKSHTKSRKMNKNNPNSMSLPPSKKFDEKHDLSVGRVQVLASQSKARKFLFMFGLGRFPLEMEMSDIRSRVNRQSRQGSSRRTGGGDKVADGRSSWKCLWRLVRILGCGGGGGSHHANTVVKASFGNIPYV